MKNGSLVLVIILTETPNEVAESESKIRELESVKADTCLLSSDDDYYMQVFKDINIHYILSYYCN